MNLFRYIKRFFENFSRSSKWFIRMWNNYDWDDHYLIKVMVDKMKDMRYQLDVKDKWFVDLRHQPDRLHASNDKDYNIIDCLDGLDKAIEIGERILKNDYVKYTPEVDEWFKEHNDFLNSLGNMTVNIRKQWKNSLDESENMEQKDRKDFFDIIRDNHQLWWS